MRISLVLVLLMILPLVSSQIEIKGNTLNNSKVINLVPPVIASSGSSGGGNSSFNQTFADVRYLLKAGDTYTGALQSNVSNGNGIQHIIRCDDTGLDQCVTFLDAITGTAIGFIGRVNGLFWQAALGNQDIVISNDDLGSYWRLHDNGYMEFAATSFQLALNGNPVLTHDGVTGFFSQSNWNYGGVYTLTNILALSTTDGLHGIYSPVTFDGEVSSGYYRPSPNNISLQILGNDRFDIDNFTTIFFNKTEGKILAINNSGIDLFSGNITNVSFAFNKSGQCLDIVGHNLNGSGLFGVKNCLGSPTPHQTVNITRTTTFGTRVNNTSDRPFGITVNVEAMVSGLLDDAYILVSVQNDSGSFINTLKIGIEQSVSLKAQSDLAGNFVVQSGRQYNISSVTAGSGSVNLYSVWRTQL